MKRLIAVICMLCLLLAGCAGQKTEEPVENVGAGLTPQAVEPLQVDERFSAAEMSFALRLFQQTARERDGKNLLISPLSAVPALAMTANGAAGKTQEEMLAVLGGLSMEELNRYLYSYLQGLGEEVKLANSVWIRDAEALSVQEDFLQTNVDYYDASVYKAPFDESTVREINGWVDENTDGMIHEIIEEIQNTAMLYLINALAFEAEWQTPYTKNDVRTNNFYALDGTVQDAEMMYSDEHDYIEDEKATGFLKDYAGGDYRFAALLPNEGVDVYEYVAGLTAEGLQRMLSNAENVTVETAMPKFSYEYEVLLNDTLASMGMPTAFDAGTADFSGMAEGLYISEVRHKTFIEVTEAGTRAAAVTSVAMDESAPVFEKFITLNRPFVYFIIDAENDLPVFMGIVTSVN